MKYTIYFKGEPSDYGLFDSPDEAAKRLLWDNGYWGMKDDTEDFIAPADYLNIVQTEYKTPALQDWSIEGV